MTEQLTQTSQQSINSLVCHERACLCPATLNPSLGTFFWKHALDQNTEMNFRLEHLGSGSMSWACTSAVIQGPELGKKSVLAKVLSCCLDILNDFIFELVFCKGPRCMCTKRGNIGNRFVCHSLLPIYIQGSQYPRAHVSSNS